MADIFDTLISGQSSKIDNKKLASSISVLSPVLFSTSLLKDREVDYTFLSDELLYPREIALLKKIIQNKGIVSYQILYALQIKLEEKDMKKTLWRQYKEYKWNYEKYIKSNSKIISFGRSIFSLTESNDLDCSLVMDEDSDSNGKKKEKNSIIQGFYDTILWKTSFYHPSLRCQIFPVDSWYNLVKKETGIFKSNFEYWFFSKQLDLVKAFIIKPLKIKKIKNIVVENPNEWLIEHTCFKETIGFDIETGFDPTWEKGSGFDPWSNKTFIHCITIAFESDPYTGYYLRFKDINHQILEEFLKGRRLIGTNLKFDGRFCITKAGIKIENFNIAGDTIQLQQIVNEQARKGLKSGIWCHTYYGGYDNALDEYLDAHPEIHNNYSLIPEEILVPYSTTDPCTSLILHKALIEYRDALDQLLNRNNKWGYNLKWVYEEIMIPTLNVFLEAELEGVYIDEIKLNENSIIEQKQIEILKKEITEELGIEVELLEEEKIEDEDSLFEGLDLEIGKKKVFNLSSTDQLGQQIEKLGWKIDERNEKGYPTTGEKVLTAWSKQGYTLADKILKLREHSKLLSTYIGVKKDKSGLWKWIHNDDRIHSLFNNFGALSLRNLSNGPNGQNYVSHGEKAEIVRKPITPRNDPTYGFLSSDFSGLQLKILAFLSKDKVMFNAFSKKGGDLHSVTNFNVFLKNILGIATMEEANTLRKEGAKEVQDEINGYRFKSKKINFGLAFGASEATILTQSIQPDWNEQDLDKYITFYKLEQRRGILYNQIGKDELRGIRKSLDIQDNIMMSKLYVVSEKIRKDFFQLYVGLNQWIEETRELAKKQGYVQSPYGTIRRLPYLLFNERKSDVDYKKYFNLLNICLNTLAQVCESIIVNRSIIKINTWRKQNNKNLFMFLNIHDAIEYYVKLENNEWKDCIKKIHEICEEDYPEYEGIKQDLESNISDYYGKEELWDMGKKYDTEKVNKL